jgi:hypothetical protein
MFLTFALFTILITVLELALPICRGCRADGGGADGHGVRSPPQGKDTLLKFLADRHHHSFLLFLGIAPELVEGSVPLKTELTVPGVGSRRPDRVYLLADGSLLDLEFQSTAADAEIFRFILYGEMLLYGAMRAGGNPKPDRDVSIRVTVVYTGGLGKRPRQSYPDESRRGECCLHFALHQVFLEERVVMADVIRDYRKKITDWKPGDGDFRLTPCELIRLYLAPLGLVPEAPWEAGADYLAMSRSSTLPEGKPMVTVIDKNGASLMPCTEKKAKLLLRKGRAEVASRTPYVIRLKDKEVKAEHTAELRLKMDDGVREEFARLKSLHRRLGMYPGAAASASAGERRPGPPEAVAGRTA